MVCNNLMNNAPLILSIVSIIIAICVPSRIANKQNKIALFEKRYRSYATLLLVKAYKDIIKELQLKHDLRNCRLPVIEHFESNFRYQSDTSNQNDCMKKAISALRESEYYANMLPLLLLSKKERKKCEEMIGKIYEPFFTFITCMIKCNPEEWEITEKALNEFINGTETFFDCYEDYIEEKLV